MGRISALTELTSLASDDYLVVLDSSANIAKKITVANAFGIPDFGWTAAGESWTYSSYTSSTRIGIVTVPSDATTKYSLGMKIKITQATGGTKYARITAVTSTTLSFLMLNSTTLNNEAITSPAYSTADTPYAPTPVDFQEPTPWQSVTFSNSWVDYGSNYDTAQYRKLANGMVELKGFVKNGTTAAGTQMFTLPVGYRPGGWNYFPAVTSSGSTGSIEIRSTGFVGTVNVTATYTSIPHLVFSGEA